MSEKQVKHPSEIYFRSYPKVIFYWPLLITSFILWLIQAISYDETGTNSTVLGYVNIFVTAFDFSSTKFFVLILLIVVAILVVIFVVLPNFTVASADIDVFLGLPWQFYMVMSIILAFILGIVIISARFEY